MRCWIIRRGLYSDLYVLATGRIVRGGQFVDGVPLHKTNIAIDPKTPVKISGGSRAILGSMSKYGVVSVRLASHARQALSCRYNKFKQSRGNWIICLTV